MIKVVAEDRDSEHFGKVSYSIIDGNGNNESYFWIADDGWITLIKSIDYEQVGNCARATLLLTSDHHVAYIGEARSTQCESHGWRITGPD